jgi:hypothetical protein
MLGRAGAARRHAQAPAGRLRRRSRAPGRGEGGRLAHPKHDSELNDSGEGQMAAVLGTCRENRQWRRLLRERLVDSSRGEEEDGEAVLLGWSGEQGRHRTARAGGCHGGELGRARRKRVEGAGEHAREKEDMEERERASLVRPYPRRSLAAAAISAPDRRWA